MGQFYYDSFAGLTRVKPVAIIDSSRPCCAPQKMVRCEILESRGIREKGETVDIPPLYIVRPVGPSINQRCYVVPFSEVVDAVEGAN